MKLFFSPGACSMATHIVLLETEQPFELDKVDLGTKKTQSGEDYTAINPSGYVPSLQLNNGEILTESAVILQYVGDQAPGSDIFPAAGSMDRYRVMGQLNFISSEIHKTLGVLFNPKITAAHKDYQLAVFGKRCDVLSAQLAGKIYLTGETFTVADAYLFTVLSWCKIFAIDLSNWPVIVDYLGRVASRPSVQEALKAEGLLE